MRRRRYPACRTFSSTWFSRARRARTAFDVNRDFDRIGADYNAFTSEENTVFYACILPEYLPQAVDILADILRPSLRDEDFDMEKKVIIEEIGMYEDQPMWCAYDQAKKSFFADHPLGNSVLGSTASVGGLTRDADARIFSSAATWPRTSSWPWRGTSSGATSSPCWKNTAAAGRSARRRARTFVPADVRKSFEVVPKRKVQQEHVFLLAPGPSAELADAARGRHAGDGRRRRFRQPLALGPRRSGLCRLGRLQLFRLRGRPGPCFRHR